ncbi:unnamed protein product [Oppiella nova]|uniref:18 kDa Sin3-associated polypeptide n=1 Tax=Oppiella nova TaxID=334625 RepID=A0A7R9M2Y0_9ACAR|nr:unnamed protein product [Oppiella nova]CAG2169811.1 unnamed protein product [Oppiella nova]
MTSQVVTAEAPQEDKPIDREKVCIRDEEAHKDSDLPAVLLTLLMSALLTGRLLEVHMCTWLRCLKEITGLVKEVNPESRRKGTFFDFALVYPDPRTPAYRMRDVGSTCSGSKGPDDGKTLAESRFQIGVINL